MYRKIFLLSLFLLICLNSFPVYSTSLKKELVKSTIIHEEWHGIYFKGAKLGFLHSFVEELKDDYRLNIVSYIKTESFGSNQEITLSQESYMDKNFKSKSFHFVQEMSGHSQTIEGEIVGNKIKIKTYSSGNMSESTIEFPKDAFLSSDIIFMIVKKGLKVGQVYNLNMFIEPLQSIVPVEIKVKGKEKIKFKGKLIETFVIEEKMSGVTSKMWITSKGDAIKEISFEGFELLKEGREKAIQIKNGTIPVSSLIAISLIAAESKIEDAGKVKELKIKVTHSDAELLPEDHRQQITSEKKTVSTGESLDHSFYMKIMSEKSPEDKLYEELTVRHERFNFFLGETHTIQTTHPDIVSKAKKIIGAEKNLWLAAKKINRWVYENMKKKPVDTFSALESLKTLEGECQSHTNLFVALARAAGIPAMIVNGVVYSPFYKGFLFHAWPQVYVGKWIAMDPTLGEEIADATHIKLFEGDLAKQLNLLKFIGKLKITIIN